MARGGRGGWRWWSVRVLVHCTCDDPEDDGDTWDHSVRLVRARNEDEAARRGARFAAGHDTEYIGGTGYPVRWRFDRVLEVYDPVEEEVRDGMEVYSRLGMGRGRERPVDPMDGWTASRRLEKEWRKDLPAKGGRESPEVEDQGGAPRRRRTRRA